MKIHSVSEAFSEIMDQEKFDITWHAHTDHLREMLRDMISTTELTDVTLVSEDKEQFKTHKIVLCASSPVFKSIVNDIQSTNPVIYLKGIQSNEIESILKFLYLGQVTISQGRMNEFYSVAESLGIKEISKEIIENEHITNELQIPKAKTEHIEKLISNDQGHMDSKLNITTAYFCDQCDKHFSINSYLKQHIKTIHGCNKYPCEKCNYEATTLSNLKKHIESVHERVLYPCNQCEYQATQLSSLYQHIRIVHEGVKLPCNQCDYKATRQSHLQQHIRSIHDGFRYSCTQCDYRATRPIRIKKHMKPVH